MGTQVDERDATPGVEEEFVSLWQNFQVLPPRTWFHWHGYARIVPEIRHLNQPPAFHLHIQFGMHTEARFLLT
jgi:hypothetical protein